MLNALGAVSCHMSFLSSLASPHAQVSAEDLINKHDKRLGHDVLLIIICSIYLFVDP